MKQETETNKNDSYYNKKKEVELMETDAEALSTKKKNERFLEALKTLSDHDPLRHFPKLHPNYSNELHTLGEVPIRISLRN